MPDDDVALEFDGPDHFIKILDGAGGERAVPGRGLHSSPFQLNLSRF